MIHSPSLVEQIHIWPEAHRFYLGKLRFEEVSFGSVTGVRLVCLPGGVESRTTQQQAHHQLDRRCSHSLVTNLS